MSDIDGTVTIVTGGATGIGRATAALLRSRGGEVAIVGPAGAELEAAGEQLGVEVVAGDASDPAVAEATVASAMQRWGRVDALVGCAGRGAFGSVASATDNDWDQVLTANLRSAISMTRAAMPHLVEAHGAIVLVSSLAGVLGVPQAATYTVSKHALVGLVRSLATDFGPSGVRTNAVCPGPVRTAMLDQVMDLAAERLGIDRDAAYERATALNPRKSVAAPEEIAEVIAFLPSHRSAAVNGAVLMADGGVSASDLSMAAMQ
jgi:meso-butanediol dehydrogenase/(S,S)-butanediol dehydrogenase/diacetyl reductase